MVALAELHQEVRAAIEAGEVERPRQICHAILAVRPDNLETLLLNAELSLEAGARRAAIEGFERVLAGDPEAYLAYAGLAIAYEGLRDPAAALHWYSRALDLEPMNREIQRERNRLRELAYPGTAPSDRLNDFATARSFLSAGYASKALESYHVALRNEPGRLEIRLGLAELHWMLRRTAEAEALCQQVLAAAPRAVKAQALLACTAAEAGDVTRGRALLADVHDQDPDGHIGGHLLMQTDLISWVTERVDLRISVGSPAPPDGVAEPPTWARWMRTALWQVLRLVLPPDEDEDAALELPPASGSFERPRAHSTTGPLGRRLTSIEEAAESSEGTSEDLVSTSEQALVSEEILRLELEPLLEAYRRMQPPVEEHSPIASDEETVELIEPQT